MSVIRHLTRKSMQPSGPASLLCFFYDSNFVFELARTGHQFYGMRSSSVFEWNPVVPTLDTNDNVTMLPGNFAHVKHHIGFDAVICNERVKQYITAIKFSQAMHLPLIIVDHSAPLTPFTDSEIHVLKASRIAAHTVACNPLALEQWQDNTLIPPGTDVIGYNEGDRAVDVSIVGNFIEDEYHIVKQCVEGLENYRIVGNNPGLSSTVGNWEEYEELFTQSKIHIHLPTDVSIQRPLRLAMMAGCAIITSETAILKETLEDGKTAIFIKDSEDILKTVAALLKDEKRRSQLGRAAREYAMEHFSMDKFVTGWDKVITDIRTKVYTNEKSEDSFI